MKPPTRQHELPTAINQHHLLRKKNTLQVPLPNTCSSSSWIATQRNLSFTQVFIPDQEEGENGGTLPLHISWSVKTVTMLALTTTSWLAYSVGVSDTQSHHQLLEKNKDEWKWGSQRQNKFLYFAITLRPMQASVSLVSLLQPLCRPGLSEEPCWDSSSCLVQHPGKNGNRLKESSQVQTKYFPGFSLSCHLRLWRGLLSTFIPEQFLILAASSFLVLHSSKLLGRLSLHLLPVPVFSVDPQSHLPYTHPHFLFLCCLGFSPPLLLAIHPIFSSSILLFFFP